MFRQFTKQYSKQFGNLCYRNINTFQKFDRRLLTNQMNHAKEERGII